MTDVTVRSPVYLTPDGELATGRIRFRPRPVRATDQADDRVMVGVTVSATNGRRRSHRSVRPVTIPRDGK